MARGVRRRCPNCGKGRSLEGYIRPASQCAVCGEALSPYQSADFAPYLVVFVIGLTFTPFMVALTLTEQRPDWMIAGVLAVAITAAVSLLPLIKGAVIGLLWALDVRAGR